MPDFLGDRECVTHHYACDCREAEARSAAAERDRLKEVVEPVARLGCFDFSLLGTCATRDGTGLWCVSCLARAALHPSSSTSPGVEGDGE